VNTNYNAATIVAAFNSQTYIQDKMDVQDTPLYDEQTLAASSTVNNLTANFFSNVGPQSSKSIGQTNMQTPNELRAPEAFSVFGFLFRIGENILYADILMLMNTFVFEFFMGTKVYQRSPLWLLNPGGGIFGSGVVGATTGQTLISNFSNGYPSREGAHRLAIPVVIENKMSFYGQLNGTATALTASGSGGTGAFLQIVLRGFYARGVQ
jgi:hypothetical protein